ASIDDVGRCINPLIVHGQTHGAIAQGVGQALWEQCYVERDSGQPLMGSLMDYALLRADTLPPFATEIAEVLSPTNPLGIKAAGEGGTTAAPAVVISAIVDALRDYGVRDIRMPATPYNIWQTNQDAKAAGRTGKKRCYASRGSLAPHRGGGALGRAKRKIVGRRASGSCIRKVPPFVIVVCKSLFAHGREEHLSPAPLFGADGGARGVAGGIEAVETRAHVDRVVGAALRERPGARPVGGGR